MLVKLEEKGQCTPNFLVEPKILKQESGRIPLHGSLSAWVGLVNCMTKRVRTACLDVSEEGLGNGVQLTSRWTLMPTRKCNLPAQRTILHSTWRNRSALCDTGKASAATVCPGLLPRCGPSGGHLEGSIRKKSKPLKSPHPFPPAGIMKNIERRTNV